MIEANIDLSNYLIKLVELVSDTLKTRSCSIMMCSNEQNGMTFKKLASYSVSTSELKEFDRLSQQIAEYTVTNGGPLYIANIHRCEFLSMENNVNNTHKSLISLPVTSNNQVIVVMNLGFSESKEFLNKENQDDINIAKLFVLLIEKSIHITQLNYLINSKLFRKATLKSNDHQLQCIMFQDNNVIPNPEKISKLLAKSFYTEMSRLGLQPHHIIHAASEIINQLNISFDKHNKER
jgi:transcriptional regulator with GAF, ATPase, and Fis domain